MPGGIQNLGQPALQNLERQHLASGPLGRIGNLSFKAAPGATPRASSPNVFQRIGKFLADMAFRITASPAQRAQQRALDAVRDNSRRIGDLLGHLTAPSSDVRAQLEVARSVAALSESCGGDLSNLPGGKEALTAYMQDLGIIDLTALKSGTLASDVARSAVLASMEPPLLREQAADLLAQIADALDQQLARVAFTEPVATIAKLMGTNPINGQALQDQLTKLADSLAMLGGGALDACPGVLSKADLGALGRAMQPAKLDAARQALANVAGMDAEQIQRSEAALDRLSEAMGKEARLRTDSQLPPLLDQLDQAVASGDRAAITRELFRLAAEVDALHLVVGSVLPDDAVERLRDGVSRAVDALRDTGRNPDGPLTRDSLRRVDDNSLGLLLIAGSTLQPFGLKCVKDDARAEAMARVQTVARNVELSAMDFLRAVADGSASPHQLVRQLHELGSLEHQRTHHLGQLGYYGSYADRDLRTKATLDIMGAAVRQLIEQGEDDVVQRAVARMDLLQGLVQKYSDITYGMSEMTSADGTGGPAETLKSLKSVEYVLGGLLNGLPVSAEDADKVRPLDLPPDYDQAFLEQYGLIFDTDTFTTGMPMTDDMRARMAPFLDLSPTSGGEAQQVTLPVRGADTQFRVDPSFYLDGIERPSVSLSVRGPSLDDSSPVRATWPRGVPDEARDAPMGEALDALVNVAGESAEPLTRLMNQQFGAALLEGLQAMGKDSPFKLEDGSVITPVGRGRFHFDIEKTDDGSFRVGATLHMAIKNGVQKDAKGEDFPVPMNPDTSWAEVQVMLHVTPDGLRVRMGDELPQFRYHFEPVGE